MPDHKPFHIIDLNYISLYIRDFQQAITFYMQVFGAPAAWMQSKPPMGGRWALPS